MIEKVVSLCLILMLALPAVSAINSYGDIAYGSGCYGLSNCTTGESEETPISDRISSSEDESGGFATVSHYSAAEKSPEEIPDALLDVTFKIEEPQLNNSRRLISVTTFQNFGTTFFPVNLEYNVYNDHSELVYSTTDVVDISTEDVAIKRFEDLHLLSGEYVLELVIRYSNVTEKFNQKFEVSERPSEPLLKSRFLLMVASGLFISTLIILLTIYFLSKKRRYKSYGF